MSGVGTGIAIAAGVGAASSVGAGVIQAGAAKHAADVQKSEQQQALDFQKQQWETQQQNEAPFLKAGQAAVGEIANAPNFVAPTVAEAAATPGYEFTKQQGEDAISKMNAATGNVFSGNQLTDIAKYTTGLADSTYNDVYNRSLGTYEANLNRLQSLAGEGLTSAGQLGTEGSAAAGNVGNIDVTTGRGIAQDYNNMGAAMASGFVGAGNAFTGGVNSLSQYAMLQQMMGPGGFGGGGGYGASTMDPSLIDAAAGYVPASAYGG